MKNSNDTIVNRTRDLPACSAVPQPTAPTRAPHSVIIRPNFILLNPEDGSNRFLRNFGSYRRHIPDDILNQNVLLHCKLCNASRVPAVLQIGKFGMYDRRQHEMGTVCVQPLYFATVKRPFPRKLLLYWCNISATHRERV